MLVGWKARLKLTPKAAANSQWYRHKGGSLQHPTLQKSPSLREMNFITTTDSLMAGNTGWSTRLYVCSLKVPKKRMSHFFTARDFSYTFPLLLFLSLFNLWGEGKGEEAFGQETNKESFQHHVSNPLVLSPPGLRRC